MLCLLAFLGLAGCSVYPYVELGAGLKSKRSTSYVLRPECHTVTANHGGDNQRSCGGDNPTAHLAFGVEFERDAWLDRCALTHFSHYADGGSDRETHMDQLMCVTKWGGRP